MRETEENSQSNKHMMEHNHEMAHNDMEEDNQADQNTEPHCGDIPECPAEGTLWVMSNNVNNLPIRADPNDRTECQGKECENEAVFKATQDHGVCPTNARNRN